jgi:predicted dehydrogenase
MNRRKFIFDLGATTAGLALAGCASAPAKRVSANEKLNLAIIGCGNRGHEDLIELEKAGENLVAICDIDSEYIELAAKKHPGAKKYRDFRKLLEQKDIDAVLIATPDHTHAVAACAALKSGRHVYCEKPLAHTISEARAITELAAKHKRITQIGTQIHAGDNYRRVVELVRANAVGDIKEVHVWVNSSYGRPGTKPRTGKIPAEIDYDLWLGPVQPVEYSPDYVPFNWRGWWHFGGGSLADFGCHYMDLPFWALELKYPLSAEAEGPPVDALATPPWLIVRYQFPALRAGGSPLALTWYHGGKQPGPDVLSPELARSWKSGVLFMGDKGQLISDYGRHILLPEKNFANFQRPAQSIPNSIGHHKEWIEAIKTGGKTTCAFDYSGPLTETALLGNVAHRVGQKILWDARKLRATNTKDAEKFVQHDYRAGWSL